MKSTNFHLPSINSHWYFQVWQCHLGLKLQEQEQEHFGMYIFLSEELGSKPWDQTLLDVELHLEYSEHFLDMETSLLAAKPCIEAP